MIFYESVAVEHTSDDAACSWAAYVAEQRDLRERERRQARRLWTFVVAFYAAVAVYAILRMV